MKNFMFRLFVVSYENTNGSKSTELRVVLSKMFRLINPPPLIKRSCYNLTKIAKNKGLGDTCCVCEKETFY